MGILLITALVALAVCTPIYLTIAWLAWGMENFVIWGMVGFAVCRCASWQARIDGPRSYDSFMKPGWRHLPAARMKHRHWALADKVYQRQAAKEIRLSIRESAANDRLKDMRNAHRRMQEAYAQARRELE